MDPNETLQELRGFASESDAAWTEHFEALDLWLSAGGFLPTAWAVGR